MDSRTQLDKKVIIEEWSQLTESSRQLVFITGLASLQLGYNHWLCYSDTKLIREFYNLTFHSGKKNASRTDTTHTEWVVGVASSLFPLGAMMGSLLVGVLVDKFGRKQTMMINNYISLVCSTLMIWAKLQNGFVFAMCSRFLIGISMGIFSTVIPMYLLETSPLNLRGSIGMLPHIFLVIGVQTAQICAFPELLGTVEAWPILVSLPGLLAIWQILLLPSCPESPRYLLIQKKEEEEARDALKHLRLQGDVEDEMEELRREDIFEKDEKKMNTLRLLRYRPLRWQLVSVVVIETGQQLSGVNVIYLGIEEMLYSTGLSHEYARYFQMMTTALLILAIIYGMYIVDRKGRKIQLLLGFGMSTVFCLLLTVTRDLQGKFPWLALLNNVLVNFFLIIYAVGPSSLINLLVGELFLQSARSSAYVIGQFLYWFLNYLTVLNFVYVEEYIRPYSLLLASPVSLGTFFYILKIIPETKDKTFLEIQGLIPLYKVKHTPA
ncbi:solute carrier family 2, facilitated glucose transporter member 5-like [Ahaetulla prasina]|uniref:solute carrier family 2, facilitated glucose transporter member 5-like n=1 Tax=Ahaetulla prasina TaxID=499056 RepID=UPI0026496C45|nr:solute carrier family 2, facilitated glucose transporter member 5-like [Ahaetulla prasina]